MIRQLADAFRKSCRDPRYLWYFVQNLHPIHERFPTLYNSLIKRKALRLGGNTALSKLHVILRTTDHVMNLNASRNLENEGIVTRNDVIRVGGCSLFQAVSNFVEKYGRDKVRITLVIDRLSDVGMRQYRFAAEASGMDFDVVQAEGLGNRATFQTQIDIALKNSDETLALILEDDYLLDKDVLTICFEVMRNYSNVIGMSPHFHPDRVRFQDIGKLVAIDGRLYCRIFSTCCTFFMTVGAMRRYERNLRLYDGWEKGAVGCAWEKEICLAPLGWTLAEHLHRSDLSPVNKFVNGGCVAKRRCLGYAQ